MRRAVCATPHQRVAWLAVAPATGLLALLLLGPVLAVVFFSFTDWQIGAWSANLVGLANYRELFADRARSDEIVAVIRTGLNQKRSQRGVLPRPNRAAGQPG